MLAWSGLYLGLAQWYAQQRQKRCLLRADAKAQRAQLHMLCYQLNPHFFFNALNTIGALAAEQIRTEDPDVVLLDVQMRGETGFDLLDRIDTAVQVVFVTTYDEHAVRAFEVNALDYLLKPVHPDRPT